MMRLGVHCIALGLCLSVAVGIANAEEGEKVGLRVDSCPAAVEGEEEQVVVARARDNYDRGLILYEEGDFQGAVDAFVASYCARANHASFYNIGQSYERLLDFERSVLYFERYAKQAEVGSPDKKKAALRAQVLKNLPAQIRIASVPAGAQVSIENESGIRARGVANSGDAIEVRQGKYTVRVELPGYEPVLRELVAKPGVPYAYYYSLDAKQGELQVRVSPDNARIFLDDRLVGVGQYSESLALGSYKITVEAPNRLPHSEEFQITSNKPTEIGVELDSLPSSGRLTLLIAAPATVGLVSGAIMSELFDEGSLALAATLATTGIAYGGSYYGIPKSITRGDAWFMLESALIGATEAGLLASAIACGNRGEECGEAVVSGASLAGAITGAGLSVLTYKRLQFSTGDAALVGSGAIWGIGTGALFHAIFDSDARTQAPLLLAGLNIGALTAAGIVAHNDVSLRRVAIIDLAGVGGLLGGVSLAQAIDKDGEGEQNFAMLGLVAGLTAGTFLTRYLDEDSASTKTKASSASSKKSWFPALGAAEDSAGQSVLSYGLHTRF